MWAGSSWKVRGDFFCQDIEFIFISDHEALDLGHEGVLVVPLLCTSSWGLWGCVRHLGCGQGDTA